MYEKGDGAIYRAVLQELINKGRDGAFHRCTYGSHLRERQGEK